MANIIRAASRRDVLKISALSTVGGLLGAARAHAAPKSMTLMHESSFIPPYDAYIKNTMAAAYEKATGIKINYDIVSVGSLQTRITTAAETGSGPDMTCIYFNWPYLFDDKLVDVSDIADEIGKKGGGWLESVKEAVVVNGKWKAIPFGNVGQLMNYRTDWFEEAGFKEFPDTWDGLLEAGIKLKTGRPSVRLRTRPRLRRQSRLAVSAVVVVRRPGGRHRRQDGRHRFGRNRARRRFLPRVLPEDDVRGRVGLDRSQQQQGVPGRANLLHQQCGKHPVHRQEGLSGYRQGDQIRRSIRKGRPGNGFTSWHRGAIRSSPTRRTFRRRRTFWSG